MSIRKIIKKTLWRERSSISIKQNEKEFTPSHVRRECLNHLFFWNSHDLGHELESSKSCYKKNCTHKGPLWRIPEEITKLATFERYSRKVLHTRLFHILGAV